MGYTSGDVTEGIQDGAFAGDPEGLQANATPEELAATCELVKAAVVADDAAGTVTFNLAQPWGPLLATLAGTWGSVMDQIGRLPMVTGMVAAIHGRITMPPAPRPMR
ncbi:MAG: hypothetical protein R3C44_19815 [Chloroflexota bacterium]